MQVYVTALYTSVNERVKEIGDIEGRKYICNNYAKFMREAENESSEQKAVAIAWNWNGWFIFIIGKVELARKCHDRAR